MVVIQQCLHSSVVGGQNVFDEVHQDDRGDDLTGVMHGHHDDVGFVFIFPDVVGNFHQWKRAAFNRPGTKSARVHWQTRNKEGGGKIACEQVSGASFEQ